MGTTGQVKVTKSMCPLLCPSYTRQSWTTYSTFIAELAGPSSLAAAAVACPPLTGLAAALHALVAAAHLTLWDGEEGGVKKGRRWKSEQQPTFIPSISK